MNKELRSFEFDIFAKEDETKGKFVEGRAVVFGQPTDMGWYREFIDDCALDECDLKDVRLLLNHDTKSLPLARSRNNNANSTMQLSVVSGQGMNIRANLDVEHNKNSEALYSAVERGDISGMSFMFSVDKDKWEDVDSDYPTRHITSISKVFEVSCCTFPAYEQTTLEARGITSALESVKKSLDSAKAEKRKVEAEAKLEERRAALIERLGGKKNDD